MNNHRTETVLVKLPAGSRVGSVTKSLPNGFVLGLNCFIQSEGQNNLFMNVAIKDDTGVAVNKPADIRFFKPRQGGSFAESYVPINQETNGQTYIFEVTATEGSAAPNQDIYIQFVLIYAQKETCLKS